MGAEANKLRNFDEQSETPDAPEFSMGELDHSVGFLLRIAQLSLFERFFEILGNSEVKISEMTVLVAIRENPGARQGMIADRLKIKWSNMTKLVREMEGRGWIRRVIPPNDRRSVELQLTQTGRAKIDSLIAHMDVSDRNAAAMLSDEEHHQLLQLTRKVAGWPPLTEEK